MKISLNWLLDFVDFPVNDAAVREVCNRLTQQGIEVDGVQWLAAQWQGFVTGAVAECSKHPDADKLSVTRVDIGDGTTHTIVCGAPNVSTGQKVVVAVPGAVMPAGGFVICNRKLRGVESYGMICSMAELQLGEDTDGIWILPEDTPVGMPLADFLGVKDVVMEVSVTPDRADCLSHRGVAREVNLMGYPLRSEPHSASTPRTVAQGNLAVAIQDTSLCPRYMVRRVNGVLASKPSPDWLCHRLEAVGIRPRNIVVDITNYVNLAIGQPLHAFDAAKIGGAVVVRKAKDQFDFTALDGFVYKVPQNGLLICDAGETPIAVAGIIGGANSHVTLETTDVVIESACFDPSSVRRTARSMGLSTESSYRFERGTDIAATEEGLDLAVELMVSLANGTPAEWCDTCPLPPAPDAIHVRYDKVNRLLGVDITADDQRACCKAIGCEITELHDRSFAAQPPTWRRDISIEEDLVEEIARVIGYDNIPCSLASVIPHTMPEIPQHLLPAPHRGSATTFLVARGFDECKSPALTSPAMAAVASSNVIAVINPLGLETSVMRTSLIPSLLKVAVHNQHNGISDIRIFETGRTYTASKGQVAVETDVLTILMCGSPGRAWHRKDDPFDIFDLKGVVTDLLSNLKIVAPTFVTGEPAGMLWEDMNLEIHADKYCGRLGLVNRELCRKVNVADDVYAAELDLRMLIATEPRYNGINAYPAVRRDAAFVISPEVTADQLIKISLENRSEILADVRIFDEFRSTRLGDNMRSVGLTYVFKHPNRTLTDQEVDKVMNSIIDRIGRSTGAVLRS